MILVLSAGATMSGRRLKVGVINVPHNHNAPAAKIAAKVELAAAKSSANFLTDCKAGCELSLRVISRSFRPIARDL